MADITIITSGKSKTEAIIKGEIVAWLLENTSKEKAVSVIKAISGVTIHTEREKVIVLDGEVEE